MASIPIVMVPGINASARLFQDQMETLWRFGPVMIADHKRAASVAEIARGILADAPPKFALGGFSMGGYVAFEVLRQARERVTRLALIDTMARPDTPEASEKRLQQIELARAGKLDLVVLQGFANAVHPDHVADEELKAIHVAMARAIGSEAFVRQQQATIGRPDSRPDLAAISVPTAVIIGDSDRIIPREAALELRDGIPGAALNVIEGAGHLSPIEQPAQVNAALERWLSA
jgi:pimeloyl-ACP methyl ester carboxylesterase